jgi:hypothetical protein
MSDMRRCASFGSLPSDDVVTKPRYVALHLLGPSCSYSVRSSSAWAMFHTAVLRPLPETRGDDDGIVGAGSQ